MARHHVLNKGASPFARLGLFGRARRHFLLFALIALCIQGTLPYLSTNCPFYAARVVSKSAGITQPVMAADCPMLAAHATQQQTTPNHDPHHKQAVAQCPLCAALSASHSFVVAGLIALPPPDFTTQPVFISDISLTTPAIRASSFSARAPPSLG